MQIVYNLISNAIKYTIKGSVTVSLTSRDFSAVLSISDTGLPPSSLFYFSPSASLSLFLSFYLCINTSIGLGISEEEVPKVFERFHRVQNGEGRSHEGTGIGLALTEELV